MTEYWTFEPKPKDPEPAFVECDLSWLHTDNAYEPVVSRPPFAVRIGWASETPWHRSDGWHGVVESADDAPTTEVPRDYRSVVRVLAYGGHDELSVGLALLTDHRYVAWESSIDVTGSGFHEDAYGGDATIIVAYSARAAMLKISEQARECIRFATDPREKGIVDVLHDAWQESKSRERLNRIAIESGEFGELATFRVDELVRRWDA